jgi:hypothetical protein
MTITFRLDDFKKLLERESVTDEETLQYPSKWHVNPDGTIMEVLLDKGDDGKIDEGEHRSLIDGKIQSASLDISRKEEFLRRVEENMVKTWDAKRILDKIDRDLSDIGTEIRCELRA